MSELIFRAVVRLYPARIRMRFGSEMLLYMRTLYGRERGWRGHLRYWRALFTDLATALWATWTDSFPRLRSVPMPAFLHDLKHSARDLLRRPGFSLPALLTLAIGIGASTAVFTLLNGIVIAPLPYPEPDELVRIFEQNSPTNRFGISAADFLGIEEMQRSFASVAAYTAADPVLGGSAEPFRIHAGLVSADFFRTLGVFPAEGRGFEAGEDREGAEPVAVLSAALRERLFGPGADALGETVELDGATYTIVGVMSPDYVGVISPAADLWRPLQLSEPPRRGPFFLRGLGRLADGQTLALAATDLADVSRRIFPRWSDSFRDESALLTPYRLHEVTVGNVRARLLIVFAAVALVLVVAIANVVNLVLARSVARAEELAVRWAMGASRRRIAELFLGDAFVVAAAGAALGLALAAVSLSGFRAADPGLPRMAEVGVGLESMLFAGSLAALTMVVLGLAPLAVARDTSLTSALQAGGRGAAGSQRTQRLRTTLVALEFALVLPLLVAGALLGVSLVNLGRVDPGFDPANVLAIPVGLPEASYSDTASQARFWRTTLAQIAAIPAVESVGITLGLPPDAPVTHNNFDLVDRPVDTGTAEPVCAWTGADDGALEALGLRLLEGRWFDRTLDDVDPTAPWPLVVTESWARHYYPGESALGKELYSGGDRTTPFPIVGVVADVKYDGLDATGETVYFPAYLFWQRSMSLVARVRDTSPATSAAIREAIRGIDGSLPAPEITTMQDRLRESIARQRLWTRLLIFFGASTILLTAIGLFGILVDAVRGRTREIGVRMALGADGGRIVRMVLGRGLAIAGAGMGVGLALCFFVTRSLESLLFGVGRNDPLTLVAACAGLLGIALLAAYLPARRAARTDPVDAISG